MLQKNRIWNCWQKVLKQGKVNLFIYYLFMRPFNLFVVLV